MLPRWACDSGKPQEKAREVARRHGTAIDVWENGKVVAKDPNDDGKWDTKSRLEIWPRVQGSVAELAKISPGVTGR